VCKDKRDFGKGFYTTVIEEQARNWAEYKCRQYNTHTAYLYQYELNDYSDLKVKSFDAYTIEWLEFVKNNRIIGGVQHDFDIVIGPIADGVMLKRFLRFYWRGINTAEYTLSKISSSKPNNQVSIHTVSALERLSYIGRTEWKI
jgi:hypothetical protein